MSGLNGELEPSRKGEKEIALCEIGPGMVGPRANIKHRERDLEGQYFTFASEEGKNFRVLRACVGAITLPSYSSATHNRRLHHLFLLFSMLRAQFCGQARGGRGRSANIFVFFRNRLEGEEEEEEFSHSSHESSAS